MTDTQFVCVDDERGILTLVTSTLRRSGEKTVHGFSGGRIAYPKCIELMASILRMVLVTDLLMPDGGGLELVKKVRLAQAQYPVCKVYIIMFCSAPDPLVGAELDPLIDHLICKPAMPNVLLETIERLLSPVYVE